MHHNYGIMIQILGTDAVRSSADLEECYHM
jgi:hypothetical protein